MKILSISLIIKVFSIMHLNKISSFARNIIQQPRISSFLNFTRNRNDSSSFFNQNHQAETFTVPQHIRKVKNIMSNIFSCNNVKIFQSSTINQSQSDSFVSSLKNFSRRVRFYDRSEPSEGTSELRWVKLTFCGLKALSFM